MPDGHFAAAASWRATALRAMLLSAQCTGRPHAPSNGSFTAAAPSRAIALTSMLLSAECTCRQQVADRLTKYPSPLPLLRVPLSKGDASLPTGPYIAHAGQRPCLNNGLHCRRFLACHWSSGSASSRGMTRRNQTNSTAPTITAL